MITTDDEINLLLAKKKFRIDPFLDVEDTRIVVLCRLITNDSELKFSLQFDNIYSMRIKGEVLDRIVDYVISFNIKPAYFFVGFDTPVGVDTSLRSAFHQDRFTRSSNDVVRNKMSEVLGNDKYDDFTIIKYLDDSCVSTTFKIPAVEDIIRLRVCKGDALCLANKNAFHSSPYVNHTTTQNEWYTNYARQSNTYDNKVFGSFNRSVGDSHLRIQSQTEKRILSRTKIYILTQNTFDRLKESFETNNVTWTEPNSSSSIPHKITISNYLDPAHSYRSQLELGGGNVYKVKRRKTHKTCTIMKKKTIKNKKKKQ